MTVSAVGRRRVSAVFCTGFVPGLLPGALRCQRASVIRATGFTGRWRWHCQMTRYHTNCGIRVVPHNPRASMLRAVLSAQFAL